MKKVAHKVSDEVVRLSEESVYVGLGLAVLAKDQMEKILGYLVREGTGIAKDRAHLLRQLRENGKKEFDMLSRVLRGGSVMTRKTTTKKSMTKKKQGSRKKVSKK